MISDLDEEDSFFASDEVAQNIDDDFDFDDEENRGSPGAKKFALSILGVVLIVVIYLFAQDRVKPLSFPKTVLNDKWAESSVRSLPPVAKSVPLDVGWTVPNLGDAGLLPPAEGSRDTFAETRQKSVDLDKAQETPAQEAMKPVQTEKSSTTLEAGNTASPEQKREASAFVKKSENEIGKESFKNAAQLLEKSLALDPSNLKALRLNARVQVELDNMEEAIEFALKAIRLGAPLEDAAELYQLLGQAHQSLGRTKEARTAYENFLKLAPKSKRAETRASAQYIRQLISGLNDQGGQDADSRD